MQEASKKDASGKPAGTADTKSLHGDMLTEIKAVLTEDQRKKLDEIMAETGKKKKKT